MLNVDLRNVSGNYTSKYSLVIAIAKRAREHVERAEIEKTPLTEKPVTTAINELIAGKIAVMENDD
ncbi:MAG: DNA-directed RNA polymerase subunit omega [Oscillospiraceae bacterium]|jgi:DNA-directed RNA polymerase omega subunit|nr:DNA-directed RNA polymerase subunit omega [Oscillospiraceae bacterium]